MVRRVPSKQRNAKIVRQSDSRALGRLALLLLCGLVLAGGFLYGCGLHFAALKHGYQTEVLKRERDRLLEQQRRFLLEREEATSPARLERAARQLGMQPLKPEQLDPLTAQKVRLEEKKNAADIHSPTAPTSKKTKSPNPDARRRPVTPR